MFTNVLTLLRCITLFVGGIWFPVDFRSEYSLFPSVKTSKSRSSSLFCIDLIPTDGGSFLTCCCGISYVDDFGQLALSGAAAIKRNV